MSIVTCRSHLSRGVPQLLQPSPSEGLFNYVGGFSGSWRVTDVVTHSGLALKPVTHLEITNGPLNRVPAGAAWTLCGVVSSTRYVTREERNQFQPFPSRFDRNEATCAALIPIRKSAAWWRLAQDERREILEVRARYLTTGIKFLPAIARRLQFGRNLGEPFDFVTWFEYSQKDANIFDDLAAALRASEEWRYVEREIDIRFVHS